MTTERPRKDGSERPITRAVRLMFDPARGRSRPLVLSLLSVGLSDRPSSRASEVVAMWNDRMSVDVHPTSKGTSATLRKGKR